MSAVSKSVIISPDAARLAGCTATCTGTETTYQDPPGWSRDYTATATAANGWRFVEFRGQHVAYSDGVEYSRSDWSSFSSRITIYEARVEYESGAVFESIDEGLTAVFEEDEPPVRTATVSVASQMGAGGLSPLFTVSGGGSYTIGASCTIRATPAVAGYSFKYWQSSTGQRVTVNPYSFTVSGDVTWTAYGRIKTHELVSSASLSTPVQLVYADVNDGRGGTIARLVADY